MGKPRPAMLEPMKKGKLDMDDLVKRFNSDGRFNNEGKLGMDFPEYLKKVNIDKEERVKLSNGIFKCIRCYVQSFPNMTEESTNSISMLAERIVQVIETYNMEIYRMARPLGKETKKKGE